MSALREFLASQPQPKPFYTVLNQDELKQLDADMQFLDEVVAILNA